MIVIAMLETETYLFWFESSNHALTYPAIKQYHNSWYYIALLAIVCTSPGKYVFALSSEHCGFSLECTKRKNEKLESKVIKMGPTWSEPGMRQLSLTSGIAYFITSLWKSKSYYTLPQFFWTALMPMPIHLRIWDIERIFNRVSRN